MRLIFKYLRIPQRKSSTATDFKRVKARCQEFLDPATDLTNLKNIVKLFEVQLEKGLNPATRDSSSLKCYNTHIQNIRIGLEKGEFLSTHLGGTVLNFMRVTIEGPNKFTPRGVSKRVPEIMKKSSGESLFFYIAEKLRNFVWAHFSFRTEHVPLVFCFSFPLEQTSLDRGTIMGWAKGYLCEKTVGKNVNTLLRQAALEKGLSLDIKAVINDVGAAFVVGRTKTRLCSGAIVVGSGTNASYLESVKKVVGFQGDFTSPYVLINTEWASFGDKGELDSIATEVDRILDSTSINPGVHLFEKMTSGLYIGEIVRLLLVKLIEEKLLFDGVLPDQLSKRASFTSYNVINFSLGNTKECLKLLKNFKVKYSQEDLMKIQEVCWTVGERASYLVGSGLAGLAQKMAQPVVAFATEGRLINGGLPNFKNFENKALLLTEKPVKKICILPTYDSALKGSALLASCL